MVLVKCGGTFPDSPERTTDYDGNFLQVIDRAAANDSVFSFIRENAQAVLLATLPETGAGTIKLVFNVLT